MVLIPYGSLCMLHWILTEIDLEPELSSIRSRPYKSVCMYIDQGFHSHGKDDSFWKPRYPTGTYSALSDDSVNLTPS